MTTQKNQIEITQDEFITLLNQIQKSMFINVTMVTDVRMNKTGNPFFGQIKKVSSCNYLIGNDYETRVNSNEVKEGFEGNFESFKPSGKHHISKCVLVDDKTESVHYLMVENFHEIKSKVVYLKNGQPMDEIEINLMKSFLVKVSETSRQDQERKVMVITPKIENIKECTLNGTHYLIGEKVPQMV
jgi:hypothetical protein